MLRVRPLVIAMIMVAGLAGCASSPGLPASPKGPDAGTSAPVQPATTGADTGSGAFDTSGIASHGAGSKECAAGGEVMKSVTPIGTAGATGSVTQQMVDSAFSVAAVGELPSDVQPVLNDLKAKSAALVGLDIVASQQHMEAWSTSYSHFMQSVLKICA